MSEPPAPIGAVHGQVHVFPVRVYYEDTDAGGVVYHASYVRFLERARSDFLLAGGISHAALRALDPPVFFAVRRMELDFLGPARLEEMLTVRTVFGESAGARLNMAQQIVCGERAVLEAVLEIVCVTPEGRAARPPKVLVNAIAQYQGGVLKST